MLGSAARASARIFYLGLFLSASLLPRAAEAAPLIEYYQASSISVAPQQPVRLWWRVREAARVEIYDGGVQETIDGLAPEGSIDVTPEDTTIYTLIVYGLDGQVLTRAIAVSVGQAVPTGPTIVDFHATITPAVGGSMVTLFWRAENAVQVDLFDGSTGLMYSPLATEASMWVRPQTTTTYTLYAHGPEGQVVARQLTLTLVPAAPF